MLSNLTICIMTYERQFFLPEIVRYHAPLGAQILILDASKKKWSIPKDIAKYNTLNYKHLPGMSCLDRYNCIPDEVDTPYFVFRADRRHQTNHALCECVKFLEKNTDYVSAKGVWLEYNSTLIPTWASGHITGNGNMLSPLQRTRMQMLCYEPPYYDVHRTSVILRQIEILSKISPITTNIYFAELAQAMCTFLCGKNADLSHLQGITQNVVYKDTSYLDQNKAQEDSIWTKEFIHNCSTIFSETLHCEGLNNKEIYNTVKDSFSLFIYSWQRRFTFSSQLVFDNLKSLFTLLNSNGEDIKITENDRIEFEFKSLASIYCSSRFNYEYFSQNFTETDFTEQKNLLKIIKKCQILDLMNKEPKIFIKEIISFAYHKFPSILKKIYELLFTSKVQAK